MHFLSNVEKFKLLSFVNFETVKFEISFAKSMEFEFGNSKLCIDPTVHGSSSSSSKFMFSAIK